jgi:hypothetical protein
MARVVAVTELTTASAEISCTHSDRSLLAIMRRPRLPPTLQSTKVCHSGAVASSFTQASMLYAPPTGMVYGYVSQCLVAVDGESA